MTTSNIGWLVIIAAVVVVLIAALIVVMNRAKRRRRQRQAEQIREHARLETAKVDRRQALADETAAKARAAQAEAEVKAAEAARLQERAAEHHSEAATSRERLQEHWERADKIDPKVTAESPDTADESTSDRAARGEKQANDEWSSEQVRPFDRDPESHRLA
jgi:flagellar biosynthesis/type III secretory pathway M-ring protein FliF/YscJ